MSIIQNMAVRIQITKTAAEITVVQFPCSPTKDDLRILKVFIHVLRECDLK